MAELLDKLSAAGAINLEEGLKRMMGNEALYVKCLKMFLPQAQGSKLPELLAAGDIEEAIKDVHNLKGVTGNLSLNGLYEIYNEVLTRLRSGETDGVKELVDRASKQQKEVCDIIGSYS